MTAAFDYLCLSKLEIIPVNSISQISDLQDADSNSRVVQLVIQADKHTVTSDVLRMRGCKEGATMLTRVLCLVLLLHWLVCPCCTTIFARV